MAALRTQEESLNSFSYLPPRKYDVFLSFRGEDTRKNFTDHLFAALVRHGFCTYRDDDKLERGEDIGIELLKAIEESRISVIVFSRNYANSRWCLDELVKILECKSTFQQMVVPVFYDIDPSDVRAQKGSFAEAFAKHEERYKARGVDGKLRKWRAALTEAANLSGWDLQNVANGHESFIEKIVEDILKKLNLTYSNLTYSSQPRVSCTRHQHVVKHGIRQCSHGWDLGDWRTGWHAFRKDHPIEDYVELSKKVVGYAGGLPLALDVLGSFLFDKSMTERKSALEKLKVIPRDAIQQKLRISFDSLNYEEKDLFLDIACFFLGMDKNYTIKLLEGRDFFPEIEIGVLSRRCLVRIDELNRLTMHDMLRDMGREIVRRECLKEPGKRSRLWFHEDILDVRTNHTGTEAVEGLVLNLPRSNDFQVNAQAFAKMNRLRLLKLNYVHLTGSCEHLFKRMRWLCWYGFPMKSIPSNFFYGESGCN